MRDKCGVAGYGRNILGVREAVPAMLSLFRRYQVRATWATVGLLLFDSKKELRKLLPELRPGYDDPNLSPYSTLERIGDDEARDPYHYGLSLARQILDCEGMELASHTFSHYYCLERGQTAAEFRADLEASVAAGERLDARPVSLIFPRNQYNPAYLKICAELGFRAFRGNQKSWMYRGATEAAQQSKLRRAAQLADLYLDVSGDHAFTPERECGLWNLPASRFLRPFEYGRRRFDGWKLARIRNAMSAAAMCGKSFHLWWHPHNFGVDLQENIAFLAEILKHYGGLRERYGMESLTMQEAAQ